MVLQPQDCMYPLWLRGDVPIPVIFALGWAVSVYQIVTYVCAQCEGKPYSYKSDILTVFVCLIISLIVWSVRGETVQLQVGHLYCVCLSDHLFDCVVSAKENHTATSRTSGRWAASSMRWRVCRRRLKEPTCRPWCTRSCR